MTTSLRTTMTNGSMYSQNAAEISDVQHLVQSHNLQASLACAQTKTRSTDLTLKKCKVTLQQPFKKPFAGL